MIATLAVGALAIALAAGTLGRENFWVDELSSLYFSDPAHSLYQSVARVWSTETNPPLYYVYLYLWRHLVPHLDESAIRAASLLPAVLACLSPIAYSSRVMAFERRLAVTLLMSCSPGLLYYATEARGYTLAVLFATNMCFLFLAAMRSLRSGATSLRAEVALLGLLSTAAAWTHLFGVPLAAALFLILVSTALAQRREIVWVGSVALLTGAAAVFWPLAHFSYLMEIAGDHWFISLAWQSLIDESKAFAHVAFGTKWSVIPLAGTTLAALAFAWNRALSNKELLILVLALFFALVIILSLHTPVFYARYFMIVLPAVYMLVAEALGDAANRRFERRAGPDFAIVVPLALSFIFAWPVFAEPIREDWRWPAMVVNNASACERAPILIIAGAPDSGDPLYIYRHYLDPALRVRLIPVRATEESTPRRGRRSAARPPRSRSGAVTSRAGRWRF